MAVSTYAELLGHVGHKVTVASYADGANVAVECDECFEILFDFDRPAEFKPEEAP